MQLVLDPALLGPPVSGGVAAWVRQIQEVGELVGEQGLEATSAKAPRDEMLALWYATEGIQEGLAGFELARMAEEVSARVRGAVPSLRPPLIDDVLVSPAYVDQRMSASGLEKFKDHLAEAACSRRDGEDQLGVLGPHSSWEEPMSHVLVEGQVVAREDPVDGLVDEAAENQAVREFLERVTTVKDVYSQCCKCPCALIKEPELGIKAFWMTEFSGQPDELRFTVGPEFSASVAAMNYHHLAPGAKKCLWVMTLIAAGRANELEGHEERTGKGGNNQTLRVDGDPVMRAYISNRTPDAHRIFWIRREKPVFLNVTGHDGRPAL